MNCPNCGMEMDLGWMMPGKITRLTWAPKRYQFPFPRKGKVILRPTDETPTAFDFTEYPSHICKACKTVIFRYE